MSETESSRVCFGKKLSFCHLFLKTKDDSLDISTENSKRVGKNIFIDKNEVGLGKTGNGIQYSLT